MTMNEGMLAQVCWVTGEGQSKGEWGWPWELKTMEIECRQRTTLIYSFSFFSLPACLSGGLVSWQQEVFSLADVTFSQLTDESVDFYTLMEL